MARTRRSNSRNHFNLFGYYALLGRDSYHLPDNEQMRYIICHSRGYRNPYLSLRFNLSTSSFLSCLNLVESCLGRFLFRISATLSAGQLSGSQYRDLGLALPVLLKFRFTISDEVISKYFFVRFRDFLFNIYNFYY